MRRLQLLVIPVLAFIVGGTMLYDAQTKAKRAAMVEPQPATITCEALVERGPPANRHVKVTDCWFALEYAFDTFSESDEWRYVVVPIYPASVKAPCTGERVRVVARIANVRNAEELQDFLAKHPHEVLGCIWDEFRGKEYYGKLLRGVYPRLEEGSYRIVFLNEELPTRGGARRDASIGAAVLAGGIFVLAWIVCGLVRARRRDLNQEWFAEPREESRHDDHSAEAIIGHLDHPWDVMTTLRTWAMHTSFAALPIAGIFYVAQELGVVPPPFGFAAAGIGVILFFLASFAFAWTGRYFREQVYEMPQNRRLPRFARKYFDRHTGPLTKQGFIRLGDVRVTESMRVWVRLLLSPDRTCLVSLESLFHMGCYNIMSVADDGTLLHTVSVNLDRKRNTPLPSRCQWTQTGDIGHALKQHQMLVSRYFKQQPAATGCLVIDPQYALGVMDYAHRISGWSLVEYGIQRKRLPPLPRAEQLTRVVDGRKTFAWQARPNNVVFSPEALADVRAARMEQDAASAEREGVLVGERR
jgi:hypothetical protein